MSLGTNDLAADRSLELTADGIPANLEWFCRPLANTPVLLLGLLPKGEAPDARLRRTITQVKGLLDSDGPPDPARGYRRLASRLGRCWIAFQLRPNDPKLSDAGCVLFPTDPPR